MMNKIVFTSNAPEAVGPYSQAVISGNTIYVSGQLPIVPETGIFASYEITGQVRQSLNNVKAILSEAGYKLSDVVKTTVFVKNIDDFAAVNAVYAEYFCENPPARAVVEVARLPKDALIEIEVIACKE